MKAQGSVAALFMLVLASPLSAQWIHIRTVPLVTSNQTEFVPSLARGMGQLSFMLDDPLGDPFVNPAKASRLNGVTLFASPTRGSWSANRGIVQSLGSSSLPSAAANSLPFGAFVARDAYFAGGLVTYQQLSTEQQSSFGPWIQPLTDPVTILRIPRTRSELANNTYVFGLAGLTFPESRLAIGGSFSWADYGAIDGVQLLYPDALSIRQSATGWTAKAGVVADMTDNDRFEFVAGTGWFKAQHDVVSYGPIPIDPLREIPLLFESNRDQMRDWLLHSTYKRRVNRTWTLGGLVTVNWKDHPKIPNYRLANLPRDPGTSVAYNFGLGAFAVSQDGDWGFEYVYEPVTSHTWAEAGDEPGAPLLPPGFRTVDNYFDFDNHILRIGHRKSTSLGWLDWRIGAQFHYYTYSLQQQHNLTGGSRYLETDWLETALSAGLTGRFANLRIMYTVQAILGNGLVGTTSMRLFAERTPGIGSLSDLLIPPSGDLVVDGITIYTHQISIAYTIE